MILERNRLPDLIVGMAAVAWTVGCREATPSQSVEAEPWAVTAWGERYEVFPEVDPLIAGEVSPAHTHVTVLADFTPLSDGTVEIVLRGPSGEETFSAAQAVRPGIFNVDVRPMHPGEYDLLFRIDAAPGSEEIPGGTVRVGSAEEPGGVARAELPTEPSDPAEPISFLKEQQWKTSFATAWVASGAMAQSVRGLARVRPPAGADATLTAYLEGVVQSSPWPYPGKTVRRGEVLFELLPRVASGRSLPEIEAEVTGVEAESAAARARLTRLEELLQLEAVSHREVEEARVRVTSLDSRLEALRRDRDAVSAVREGRGAPYLHAVRAPFDGRIAEVSASPGAAVAPGETLGRVVRNGSRWLEVDLAPADARRVAEGGIEGVVIDASESASLHLASPGVRLVSLAPAVDPAKGTVTALLEVPTEDLFLGSVVDAQVLLSGDREGIVVPASALVDDGGDLIAYLQVSGEEFVRQRVTVAARQGESVLVEGLAPGQRLVVRGGDAIRRASLLSRGAPEGHVH